MAEIGRKLTLLLPMFKGDCDELKHLYFILSDPCMDLETGKDNQLLLVNCTSLAGKQYPDLTCVLTQGEHNFIKHDSFIFYKETRIESLFFIENGVDTQRFIKKEIINDELYHKIIKGLFESPETERKYKRFLKNAINQGACADIPK